LRGALRHATSGGGGADCGGRVVVVSGAGRQKRRRRKRRRGFAAALLLWTSLRNVTPAFGDCSGRLVVVVLLGARSAFRAGARACGGRVAGVVPDAGWRRGAGGRRGTGAVVRCAGRWIFADHFLCCSSLRNVAPASGGCGGRVSVVLLLGARSASRAGGGGGDCDCRTAVVLLEI